MKKELNDRLDDIQRRIDAEEEKSSPDKDKIIRLLKEKCNCLIFLYTE